VIRLIQSTEHYIVRIDLKRKTEDIRNAVSEAITRAALSAKQISTINATPDSIPNKGVGDD
jgi:hypothetical protein